MIKLQFCFVAKCQKNINVRLHAHDALELVYYIDGIGRSRIDRRQYEIRKNIFTVTPCGVSHDQENITDMASICVGMAGSGLEPLKGAWRDAGGILEQTLQNLIHECKNKYAAYETVCQGLLLEISGLVRRITQENIVSPGRKAIVDKAIEIISKRSGNVSVATLAGQLYVSRDYLRHLFHDYSSQSPLQYILNARLERAKTLLAGGDLSIKETAAQCSFESEYYFSRFFHKFAGITPSQYRDSLCRTSNPGKTAKKTGHKYAK